MREDRVKKRAVSDDFGNECPSSQEGVVAQISSEGALLESAPGEAGLDAASGLPVHGDLHA